MILYYNVLYTVYLAYVVCICIRCEILHIQFVILLFVLDCFAYYQYCYLIIFYVLCSLRFLINVDWFEQWKMYVDYDSSNPSQTGLESVVPGLIDNTNLFKGTLLVFRISYIDITLSGILASADDSFTDLRPNMTNELDYYLLPLAAWEKLFTWYGVLDGQNPVERKVILQGRYLKHLKVEVYMTSIKLCLFTNQNAVKIKEYSKAEILGEFVIETNS